MSSSSVNQVLNVEETRPAGPDHQVVTFIAKARAARVYRTQPCADCPWRKDATGVFPAEAFRHAARTAYDMAVHSFSCHEAGAVRPALCAGFLLRGANHNLSVRLAQIKGQSFADVHDGGRELHDSYRAMATANGVDPGDPILAPCR